MLRARLREVGPLVDAYCVARELWWMVGDTPSRAVAAFEAQLTASTDPWGYAGAAGQERLASAEELLALVPQPIASALEVGCAEGHFTERLAARCRHLLAVDVTPTALARAELRLRGRAVSFAAWNLRRDPPPGAFDLVVAMDVLEGFSRPGAVAGGLRTLIAAVRPGGHLLIGNSRQGELFDQRWWGRLLTRGGVWIDRRAAAEPALERVATRIGGFYVNTLFLRR